MSLLFATLKVVPGFLMVVYRRGFAKNFGRTTEF